MIDGVQVTDTHIVFHGPGTFIAEGFIDEIIQVDETKTRRRKLPSESGSIVIDDETVTWGSEPEEEQPEQPFVVTRRLRVGATRIEMSFSDA